MKDNDESVNDLRVNRGASKKRKKDELSHNDHVLEKTRLKTEVTQRRSKLQQFPVDDVLKALEDCRSYLSDIKRKQCVLCDYVGGNAGILQLHIGRKHEKVLKTWCNDCNVVTKNLEEHRDSCKCNEQKCTLCGDTFTKIKYLKQHLQQHCRRELFQPAIDKSEKQPSKDELPTKAYEQFPESEVLQAIADNSAWQTDNKNTTCSFCKFGTATSERLSAHLRTKHKEEYKNWCYRCNLSTEDLQQHIKNTKCSQGQCIFCLRIFYSPRHLTRHLKLHCQTLIRTDKHVNQDDENMPDADDVGDPLSDNTGNLDNGKPKDKPEKLHIGRGPTLKQFPASEVLEAIEDSRSFLNNVKNRQCLLCDHIAGNANVLQIHFRQKHKKECRRWCKHCNVLTTKGLEEHREAVKCHVRRCKFCRDTFMTMRNLKQHLQQHCRDQLFQPHVDKIKERTSKDQYPQNEVLQALADCSAWQTDIKNRTCLYCDFVSQTAKLLSVHLSTDHKEEFKNWCARCNLSTDDLQQHIKDSKCSEYRCLFCNKMYFTLYKLTQHLKTHCVSSNFQTICKEEDSTKPKIKVKRRRRTHWPNSTLCMACGKIFSSCELLRVHIRKCAREKALKCSFCDKLFIHLSTLRDHEKRHTGEKPFLCPICGKRFVNKSEHKKHLEVHEGGPVSCTICNKKFRRPGVLALHMKRHTGENPFKCFHCELSYHRASLLKTHMRSHSNEKPYKCSFCNKDFSCKTTLRKHENIHKSVTDPAAETPFKCIHCEMSYPRATLLKKHMKTHNSERPYTCSFCEKDFTGRSALKKHEDIHKGIKPYKCSICSFSCTQPYGLTIHMKQHPEDMPQPDRPYKCLHCNRHFDTNAMLMSHMNNQHTKLIKQE